MKKDILGNHELESLKINWDFAGPGLMNGHCTATGTCENQPTKKRLKKLKINLSEIKNSKENPQDIKLKYGYLRT